MSAEYAFTFNVIASDIEGYYYDDWSKAAQYKVVGSTKEVALGALWALIGDAPRGRFWRARQVGAAVDVRIADGVA